jgi:hypothetical protein
LGLDALYSLKLLCLKVFSGESNATKSEYGSSSFINFKSILIKPYSAFVGIPVEEFNSGIA